MFEPAHEAIIDADAKGYRSFAATNADRRKRVRAISFQALSAAPTAEQSRTTVQAVILKRGRIIFFCSASQRKEIEIGSKRFIRAVVLEQRALAHMRLAIACVANHEEQFRKAMGARRKAKAKKEPAATKAGGTAH